MGTVGIRYMGIKCMTCQGQEYMQIIRSGKNFYHGNLPDYSEFWSGLPQTEYQDKVALERLNYYLSTPNTSIS